MVVSRLSSTFRAGWLKVGASNCLVSVRVAPAGAVP